MYVRDAIGRALYELGVRMAFGVLVAATSTTRTLSWTPEPASLLLATKVEPLSWQMHTHA